MAPALARQMESPIRRLRLRVRGAVQGVGFRPFAYRLARTMRLSGFVLNDSAGVLIEIEGEDAGRFPDAIRAYAPPLARIDSIDVLELAPAGGEQFEILESLGGRSATRIGADAAACAECRRELTDPASRFFGYPFVNCTHCGPRFTITRALPYDRAQTSMASFPMCRACAADYVDPENRRFHAEPVACPACGPRLSHPIAEVAARLEGGAIVALKGIGGFHLICDARNDAAVALLRQRKARDEKPFAAMVRDIEAARQLAKPTEAEEALLISPASPIVLVEARAGAVSGGIAPGLRRIGLMLAYSPLHHLLLDALGRHSPHCPPALVATSANPGGEPLVADNADAARRLSAIADLIVTHDRDIAVRADDSVLQVIDGAPAFIRRARGFVPEPVDLGTDGPCVIATGADLKNTVCVTRGREAFLSQHVGGLDNAEAIRFQREAITHLCSILDVKPEFAACDLHPDFHSVRMAEGLNLPVVPVQHHLAHVAAVAAEHRLQGSVLGLALDGHGFGTDGTSWGGEMLAVDGLRWHRAGSLVPLPLPGGDRAAREPWRMGVSVLEAAGRIDLASRLWPDHSGVAQLAALFARGMRPPVTSSLGRLFDAAAAISGVRLVQGYEGQAAMEFEALVGTPRALPDGYVIQDGALDFRPLLLHLAEGARATAYGDGVEQEACSPLLPLGRRWPGGPDEGFPKSAEHAVENPSSALRASTGAETSVSSRPSDPQGEKRGRAHRLVRESIYDWLADGTLCAADAADIFHGTVIAGLADWAATGAADLGTRQVALGGGCMMNRVLAEGLARALRARGLEPYLPRLAPANDGGIALGQAAHARQVIMNEHASMEESRTCA